MLRALEDINFTQGSLKSLFVCVYMCSTGNETRILTLLDSYSNPKLCLQSYELTLTYSVAIAKLSYWETYR